MALRPYLASSLALSTLLASAGCGDSIPSDGTGGGGPLGAGGVAPGGGGLPGSGGIVGGGGVQATGGQLGSGGAMSGGGPTSGGATSSGGGTSGGASSGGATGGGSASGGASGSGGSASGGASGSGGAPIALDCNAAMPTSGASHHNNNGQGGSGNLAWEIWSNTGTGQLTTYDVPAFSAVWNNDGGYLGRMGYEWGGFGQTPGKHQTRGTISAQFVAKKTGDGGDYSYIGVYGWTTDPCVEWYIVEDILPHQFNKMPFNPGNTVREDDAAAGGVPIDDGNYIIYSRQTTGTGGSRCSGVNSWAQYYSVRTTARSCGTISITEHFETWESLGLTMGNLLEAKLIAEVGGGTGRVDFPVALVTATNP